MSAAGDGAGRIAAAVGAVRARVAAAAERSGRDPAAVRLVAVTKTVGLPEIGAALRAGVRDLGENRVQEAAAKAPGVGGEVTWHLVGHLQRNKAGRAAALFDMIHSLDGLRLAEDLDRRRPVAFAPLPVLVEVDLTGLSARTGIPAAEAEGLVRRFDRFERVRLAGLMTMAAPGDGDAARHVFRALRRLRDRLQDSVGVALAELSMGMSDDFEEAVEEGATMVRIGRAIFGERA